MSLNAAPSVTESKHRFSLFAELRAHTGPNQPCLRLWLLINRFRLSVLRFWNTNAVYRMMGIFVLFRLVLFCHAWNPPFQLREHTYFLACLWKADIFELIQFRFVGTNFINVLWIRFVTRSSHLLNNHSIACRLFSNDRIGKYLGC